MEGRRERGSVWQVRKRRKDKERGMGKWERRKRGKGMKEGK